MVPEPYVRAQRPDQRVRAVSVLADSEALTDTLEKKGVWFRPAQKKKELFRKMTDDELRERLRDIAELVSGSRRELLERLHGKKADVITTWSKDRVETECQRLGLQVLEKKQDNVKNIRSALKLNRISKLSDEDLIYELAYRGLEAEDSREDSEKKLQAYLDGRLFD
ncbi:Kif3b [Symbiodinium pilosum]|uniref:Kif3b protein n=1 Tax=Symbiodinium pilosum TaxID=2952 RepID=A0A812Q9Y9_SYMPI|nr:Kif3b [Symbiodinium pilosum]